MLNRGMLSTISSIGIGFIAIIVFFLAMRIIQIYNRKRHFKTKGIQGLIFFIVSLVIFGGIEYCLYHIPDLLMYGIPWAMIDEMGPTGFINTVIILATLVFTLFAYSNLFFFFVKSVNQPSKNERID